MKTTKQLIKSTKQLNHEIAASNNIHDFLSINQPNLLNVNFSDFSEYLNMLLSEKKLRKTDVIRDSQLDRVYAYQIFSGKKLPSYDKLIALAFGMHLTIEETGQLLKIARNRQPYARDPRDAVILFALQHKMTLAAANELLYAHGLKLLGAF